MIKHFLAILSAGVILLSILIIGYLFFGWNWISDFNNTVGMMGLLVTTISFVIGCYFVLLAVNAYSHVIKIQDQSQNINDMCNLVSSNTDKTKSIFSNSVDVLDTLLGDVIYLKRKVYETRAMYRDDRTQLKNEIKEAYRDRAILGLRYKDWDIEKRKLRIGELKQVAKQEDIIELQQIASGAIDDVPEIQFYINDILGSPTI